MEEKIIRFSHDEFKKQMAVMMDFVTHQIDVYNNIILSKYGVTHSQAKILVRLSESPNGRLSQKEFTRMGRRNSTITATLNNLEKGGFITRTASETDARAKFIQITQKGQEVQQVALKNVVDLENLLVEGFSDEEKILFKMLLKRVEDNIKKINGFDVKNI